MGGLWARLRAIPAHQWILIAIGIVSVIIAYKIWRGASGSASTSAANASAVPGGGAGQPDWASLGAGQSTQGNQILDELQALQQALASGAASVPTSSAPSAPASGASSSSSAASGHQSATTSGRTYTVLGGDTLAGIASRFGTTWQALYSRNQQTIDSTAQAHGESPAPGDGYAHWIFPGEQLQVG